MSMSDPAPKPEGMFTASLRETDPEIAEPIIMRSASDLPPDLSPHMPALIAWHFEQAGPLP